MQGKGSAFCGSATSLEVRYTDKPVSGWGGLVAVQRYLEKRGVAEVPGCRRCQDGRTLPQPDSGTRHCVDFLGDGVDRRPELGRTRSCCAATQWCGRSWA